MGYAYYEIIRQDGRTIRAGYGVKARCEKRWCWRRIDRGLGYLCGKSPGGDEHGCGGYFCGQHLYGNNQCEACGKVADEANAWVHPETGEEFDLRDHFLPVGVRYDARGIVWRYAGFQRDGSPALEPVRVSGEGVEGPYRLLTEGEWEDAARVAFRQRTETPAA